MPLETETTSETKSQTQRPWNVVLYNDDWHEIDDVVRQVQKATCKSEQEASDITLEAHSKGKAVAFTGPLERCHRVAKILREIRLQVEVDEWY